MRNKVVRAISLLIVICTVFSLISCTENGGNGDNENTKTQTKAQTSEAVKIVNVPTDEAEIIKMFNAALDYVDVYCYKYSKSVKCEVSDISVGSLSAASNATDAFKSIFGQIESMADYDYNASKESFDANFPKSGFTAENISSVSAKQDGDSIAITVELPGETNPDNEKGQLYRLGGDYISVQQVNQNLKDFDSSATSVGITASDIIMTAKISADDSSLISFGIKYTEKFSLSGVTLVKLEGSAVTGRSETVIEYTDIGRN